MVNESFLDPNALVRCSGEDGTKVYRERSYSRETGEGDRTSERGDRDGCIP